jgi:hypothetical protein
MPKDEPQHPTPKDELGCPTLKQEPDCPTPKDELGRLMLKREPDCPMPKDEPQRPNLPPALALNDVEPIPRVLQSGQIAAGPNALTFMMASSHQTPSMRSVKFSHLKKRELYDAIKKLPRWVQMQGIGMLTVRK